MAILITGGTGELGSNLVRHLVADKGHDGVVVYDRYPDTRRISDVLGQVTIVQGNVLEFQELIETIEKYQVDRIIHLAYILGSGNPKPDRAVPFVRTLCMGPATVFEAARIMGVPRVVVASSAAVFGRPGDHGKAIEVQATEEDKKRPRSVYGASKLWAEGLAEWYNSEHQMEILSLRICKSFGFGTKGSLAAGYSTMRPRTFFEAPELIAAGADVIHVPPGHELYDFLYSADTAEAFWLAATVDRPQHSIFNLRAEQRPVGDWSAQLCRMYPQVSVEVDETLTPALQIMDNARILAELSFQPKYTLETGLEEYAEQVRRLGSHP